MQISEKEAIMNKKRIQHSLSVGMSMGGDALGGKMTGNMKYTRMWFKEAAETLTSGRATTISAVCNGFYLWYWTVSVGTWGEGDAVIPTQLFYCSDRSTPPVCKPRIAGMADNKAYGKLCNGHDVDADFDEKSNNVKKPWQSMHSGRPKPIRLQGQKDGEPVFLLDQSMRGQDIEQRIRNVEKEEDSIERNLDLNDPKLKNVKGQKKKRKPGKKPRAINANYGEYMDDTGIMAEKGTFIGHAMYDDHEENDDSRNGLFLGAILTLNAILMMGCGLCFMYIIGYLWKRNKNKKCEQYGSLSAPETV